MTSRSQTETYAHQNSASQVDSSPYLADLVNFYEAWKSFWQLWLREHMQGRPLPRKAEQGVLQSLHTPESRVPEGRRVFWQGLQKSYHNILQKLQDHNFNQEPASDLFAVMNAAEDLERQCFDEIVAFSRNLGEVDPLTGLLNRRRMEDDICREQALVDRGAHAFIAMLDVDHFKVLNDRFGHVNGDLVLKELSRRLHSALRPYDGLYRYGGEEFLAIFPQMHKSCALLTAQRLCQKIASASFPLEKHAPVQVTISIGITPLLPNVPSHERVVIADAALYQAKHEGRNQARLLP